MKNASPSSNLCNVPPLEIASTAYNDSPKPLYIQGVRDTHRHFFKRLKQLNSWEERAQRYEDYMVVAFCLTQWRRENDPSGKLSLKHGYLRFLRGWLFNSDSVEGAVLKG
jgi:NAD+--dinitrogen-reductase ADP-D-ribosyltransferase